MRKVPCDYCGELAVLRSGSDIYPHRPDLRRVKVWECGPCDARVGCHPGTTRPLGRLANAELRAAKQRAHRAFDPIWKGGHASRGKAYRWLAFALGIDSKKCHIGMFDVETCNRVVEICRHRPVLAEMQARRRA